jgi:alpha-tubulin suppressor-like RCC1 family protein
MITDLVAVRRAPTGRGQRASLQRALLRTPPLVVLVVSALTVGLPRRAPAQVWLVPFVGAYEPVGRLGSPSAALAQNGVSARQAHAMAFGLGVGGHVSGLFGVEGGITLAPSGLGLRAQEPTTGGDLTLAQRGWMLLASALTVVGRPPSGFYGVAGVGVQKRWGPAWQGVAQSDLWSVGGVVGVGTAARLTERWRLDLRAELRLYAFDPDGGGTDFGSSLATELLVRVGVPLVLMQPRRAGQATPVAPRTALRGEGPAPTKPSSPGLPAGTSVTAIAAGGERTCAATSTGVVWCWAGDGRRQTAAPTRRETGAPGPAGAMAVTVGKAHTCVLRDRTAICWGDNRSGQLGADDPDAREHEIAGIAFSTLSAGDEYTCGVSTDGRLFCWGANDRGQLGDGTSRRRARAEPIAAKGKFTMVAAGGRHSCALRQDGVALCWGDNWSGQVGSDMIQSLPQPTEVAGNLRFSEIVAGESHTCALAATGLAWCWGANGAGQLGDGSRRQRRGAVPVSGAIHFSALVAGGDHTCGLTLAAEVWCWGRGRDGELGDGAQDDRAVPTRVVGGLRFVALAAGARHTCGLTTDGAVLCWGKDRGTRPGLDTR